MYGDPHIVVTIKLRSGADGSLGSDYAEAGCSEQVVFGRYLDGEGGHSEKVTIKHVDGAYVETGDALGRCLEHAEKRFTEQIAKLRTGGHEKVIEKAESSESPA